MKPFKLITVLTTLCAAALTSCCSSSTNIITQHQGLPMNTQHILATGERFRNIYPSPKQFQNSCSEDCYQPDPRVLCKQEAESCQVKWPDLPAITGWQLQWLGHASFRLVAPDGNLMLLDPVSAGFDWPINWLGAVVGSSRTAPSHSLLEPNKKVDAVLYSHAHYDHFNKSDLAQLSADSVLYLPMGMADYLPERGFNVHEMAWYSKREHADVNIHFVPAHHYTGRSLYELDGDKSLWGGWVLELGQHKIFFAGDTGYSPIFRDIRQKFGTMSVCLLPIGSYHGENYRNAHLAPEDALTVAEELGCRRMIPWGYGNNSWLMGDKTSHSALLRLLSMHHRLQSQTELQILNEGEIVNI